MMDRSSLSVACRPGSRSCGGQSPGVAAGVTTVNCWGRFVAERRSGDIAPDTTSTDDTWRRTQPPATSRATTTAEKTARSVIRVITVTERCAGTTDVVDDPGREIQHNAGTDNAEADQRRARPAVDESEGVEYAEDQEPAACDQAGGKLQGRDPARAPATYLEADRDERRDQEDDAPRGVGQPPACSTARD